MDRRVGTCTNAATHNNCARITCLLACDMGPNVFTVMHINRSICDAEPIKRGDLQKVHGKIQESSRQIRDGRQMNGTAITPGCGVGGFCLCHAAEDPQIDQPTDGALPKPTESSLVQLTEFKWSRTKPCCSKRPIDCTDLQLLDAASCFFLS